MDWWQELLIYISAGAISLVAGSLVGLLIGHNILKAWARRKTIIANNNLNKLDILKNESRNRNHNVLEMITASTKGEGQTFNLAYENKHSLTEQGTSFQSVPKSQLEAKRVTREVKTEREVVDQAYTEESLLVSKEAGQVLEEVEPQTKQEAMTPISEISQRMAELAESARKYQEAKAGIQMEIERLNRGIARLSREKDNQVAGEVVRETEHEAKAVRKTKKVVIPGVKGQTVGLNEIKTDLRIATTPWDGKPLPFQTRIWDTKMGEFDSLVTEHGNDLGQAYIDMALANQIVWLYTEIGYKSDDLESSYKQLCTKVAERLTAVCDKRYAISYA
jgi:hypothetical protein